MHQAEFAHRRRNFTLLQARNPAGITLFAQHATPPDQANEMIHSRGFVRLLIRGKRIQPDWPYDRSGSDWFKYTGPVS